MKDRSKDTWLWVHSVKVDVGDGTEYDIDYLAGRRCFIVLGTVHEDHVGYLRMIDEVPFE